MMPAARAPARRHGRPIDDDAHNGRLQLISDGEIVALGRWTGERWVYPFTGTPLDIVPTEVFP